MTHPLYAFSFADLYTPDPQASSRFYERLLGWTAHPIKDGSSLFRVGDKTIAGMRHSETDKAFWVPYVHVQSTDSTATRAQGLGAAILSEPSDKPGVARICTLKDLDTEST
jgi:predicted enzyme related to lactoylglutathione lyase